MHIIEPSVEIIDKIDPVAMLRKIERIGRVSHKSEGMMTEDSYKRFIPMLLKLQHMSVFEHASVTVQIVTDRGISHELVRHRLSSFMQESQRYIKYKDGLKFIYPSGMSAQERIVCYRAMLQCEENYNSMLRFGATAERARSVLTNDVATMLYVTANLRQWRWIFHERTTEFAHPDMCILMSNLLRMMQKNIPYVFDDIVPYEVGLEPRSARNRVETHVPGTN